MPLPLMHAQEAARARRQHQSAHTNMRCRISKCSQSKPQAQQWPHPRHATSSPADQSQSLGLRTRPGLPDQSLRRGTATLLTRTRRTDGKTSCSPLPMHMARYTRQWHAANSLLAGVHPVRSARQHAAPTSGKRTPKQHAKPQSPGPRN
jgi:hypothetical protein